MKTQYKLSLFLGSAYKIIHKAQVYRFNSQVQTAILD